jgi:hypothetical protein
MNPKTREKLEYLAIFATILGGLVTAFAYFEGRKKSALQEKTFALDKEIKEIQLNKLRKG